MSERPNVILAYLLAASALVGGIVSSGLAALGGTGVAGLVTMIVGAFSACIFFLGQLDRVPVSSLILVALTVASALAFARTLAAYLREQRVLHALPLQAINASPMAALAGNVRVYLTPARRPAAFCFGLLRPRIVVTSGLLARLDADEQAAAIWHELHHVRRREPLKCLLARLAASTFFWMPLLRDLLDRYLLAKELTADRAAIQRTSTGSLAGALYEVGCAPTPGAVGMADLAEARVSRLLEPNTPLPPLFNRGRLTVSAITFAGLMLLLETPLRLDPPETTHLRAMLTSTSLHGLPGMAAGLALNAAVFTLFAFKARSLAKRR